MARVLLLLLIAAALLEPAEGQCTDKWKLKKCTRKALKGKCLATCTAKKCKKTRRKCKGTCNTCNVPLSPPAPPSPPPAPPPCVDDATFADVYGYNCANWAIDCPVSDPLAITSFSMCTPSSYSDTCTHASDGECDDGLVGSNYSMCAAGTDLTDCGMPANGNGVFAGPDGVPCEVGGWGPDAGGYYYSAAYMFAVRYACPASCDMCTNTSLTCADNATYTDSFGYNCANWAIDCPITDPLTNVAAASCVDATGSTLAGPDGIPCEVGGYGPDFGGFYYSASYMFEIRYACPVSCSFMGC